MERLTHKLHAVTQEAEISLLLTSAGALRLTKRLAMLHRKQLRLWLRPSIRQKHNYWYRLIPNPYYKRGERPRLEISITQIKD